MTQLTAADDLRDLSRAEHLVLFGFRAMALGHGDCPALRGAFCGLLGADGDEALCNLMAFVRTVGWRGRRRVRLHTPGCCVLSDDERSVIAAVAAAQLSLFGDGEGALSERLAELLGGPADEGCLMAAQAVAAALACHGLTLPERAPPEPAWFASAAGVSAPSPTLH